MTYPVENVKLLCTEFSNGILSRKMGFVTKFKTIGTRKVSIPRITI